MGAPTAARLVWALPLAVGTNVISVVLCCSTMQWMEAINGLYLSTRFPVLSSCPCYPGFSVLSLVCSLPETIIDNNIVSMFKCLAIYLR